MIATFLFGCDGRDGQHAQSGKSSFPTQKEIKAVWPRFRGPGGLGISQDMETPSSWNGSEPGAGKLLWKSGIPFPGHSSPVVWGDRVFISGYDVKDHLGHIICYHLQTGSCMWDRCVAMERDDEFAPPEPLFDEALGAASTMAVDGRRAYAIFANGDLAACDFEGNLAWSRHLGVPRNSYGHASSLAMFKSLLFVQYDQGKAEGDRFISKLYAFHGESGDVAWEADRPVLDSWTSPIVIETGSGPQLITVGTPWYIAYDPTSGKEIWKVYMEGGDLAPSPVFAAGLLFALVPNYDMCAIRIDGTGDVTNSHIAWISDENIPDVASPVANDELLFLLCNGLLTCCESRTGRKLWEHEFDSDFESSPTLVRDKLYLLGREGTMFVVAPKREFEEIARSELGEPSSCSPAFVNNRIYIRGEKNLFCIGK